MTSERDARPHSVRILLIDDEPMIRSNLQAFLEDEGYSVIARESAEMGLDFLGQDSADVAIVDIRLPNMDGNLFILKARVLCPRLHFLIHTGSLEYLLPDELSRIGMTKRSILYKPLSDMAVLTQAIEGFFAPGHAR